MSAFVLAQGIPLAPSLSARVIALFVVEAVLLTLFVLLYVKWAQLTNEPLDAWWARRKREGLSRESLFEMQESEREQRLAEGAAPQEPPGPGSSGSGGARED
jgi:hypothetical protein